MRFPWQAFESLCIGIKKNVSSQKRELHKKKCSARYSTATI